jgi:hypothetical protein
MTFLDYMMMESWLSARVNAVINMQRRHTSLTMMVSSSPILSAFSSLLLASQPTRAVTSTKTCARTTLSNGPMPGIRLFAPRCADITGYAVMHAQASARAHRSIVALVQALCDRAHTAEKSNCSISRLLEKDAWHLSYPAEP